MKIIPFLVKWSYFFGFGLMGLAAYWRWKPVVFDNPLALLLWLLVSCGFLIAYLIVAVVLAVVSPLIVGVIEERITGDTILAEKLYEASSDETQRSVIVDWLLLLSAPLAMLTAMKVMQYALPEQVSVASAIGAVVFVVGITGFFAMDPVQLYDRLISKLRTPK